MRVLAVANSKGGVGKSTLAVNLAVHAVHKGQKVLLVDADPQATAALFSAARDDSLPRFDTAQMTKPILHREIPRVGESYDLVIVDVGGRDAPVFRSALVAAEDILIPLGPSAADLWATESVFELLDEVSVGRQIRACTVFTRVVRGTVVAREAMSHLDELLAEHSATLLETRIHSRVAWSQSFGEGRAVTEWPGSPGAGWELRSLWRELMEAPS